MPRVAPLLASILTLLRFARFVVIFKDLRTAHVRDIEGEQRDDHRPAAS